MQEKTLNVNITIVDDSFDTEEKAVRLLRNLGYAARPTRVEDEEDLAESLNGKTPDLVLYTQGMELISLKATCACLKKHLNDAPVPVIAIDKAIDAKATIAAMKAGATDLSSYEALDHLAQVITRELRAFNNWKKTSTLQTAFDESERRCASLMESSRDAIAYIHEGMHIYSNASYLEMFNIEESDELEGMPILDMVAHDDQDKFKAFLRDHMKKNTETEKLSLRIAKADKTEFDGEMEFSPAQIEGEPCIQVVIRQQQMGNTEELERQLKLMSQKDQLTGLFNRQYFLETMEDIVFDCEKGKYTASLMVIQIDNFDSIKNEVGVVGADEYVVAAAKAIKSVIKDKDILSRYMHSNFALIAYNQNLNSMEDYAEKIQSAIGDLEATIGKTRVNTTCCIGTTLIGKNSPDSNEVISRAEKATQEAAEQGTNQTKAYIPKEGELTRHEIDAKFRVELTDALKNNKFVLYFQPIVSLLGDTDERYEVFVRLPGEDGKLIMPQDFIPAAERVGMATAIDRWILFSAIKLLSVRWKSGKKTRFFVKLSNASLKDEGMLKWLDQQVKAYELPKKSLVFQVKESVAVANLKYSKEFSEKIKAMNCAFVLDDFGTGANPFQLLDHMSVDFVRLDRSFMTDLAENTNNQETIQRLAEQAKAHKKQIITQFVPDAGSLSILWGMGVDYIQGYFLQEPSPDLNYDFSEMTG